jgi:hypothetical protein
VGLRPLACWDCGFESRWGHLCLSLVIVVCCCCVGLITRPEDSYRVCCVSECDREASIMMRPWHTGGCCAIGKKKYIYTYIKGQLSSSNVFVVTH